MRSHYYLTNSVLFTDGELSIELVELHQGEPDGYVGLPLTITDKSKKILVTFSKVGHFKTECETYSSLSRDAIQLNSLVFEEKDSEYLSRNIESAQFAVSLNTKQTSIQHYIV